MGWVIGIAVVVFLYWMFILRPGGLDFWKLAGKYPDAAYEFFRTSPYWKVFEGELPTNYRSIVPKADWVGPFSLWVPKIGGVRIYIFGKVPEYEASQVEFMRGFSSTE